MQNCNSKISFPKPSLGRTMVAYNKVYDKFQSLFTVILFLQEML